MCLSAHSLMLFVVSVSASTFTVSTYSGSATGADVDGALASAQFNGPYGMARNSSGYIFVSTYTGCKIRVISPSGDVSTLAGSTCGRADGTGTSARFNNPAGLCIDASGNIFVADLANNAIRKVTLGGVVTTFAGSTAGSTGSTNGVGTAARFNNPKACAFDSSGNMFVVDFLNHIVRKILPDGTVSTLAGSGVATFADGTGTSASFKYPHGVAISSSDEIYIADQNNLRIRKITQAGVVTTVAGNGVFATTDGTISTGSFRDPTGISFGSAGELYVTEYYYGNVRKVFPNGSITTLAGLSVLGFADGDETVAKFNNPAFVAMNTDALLIADFGNNRIRRFGGPGVSLPASSSTSAAAAATASTAAVAGAVTNDPSVSTSSALATSTNVPSGDVASTPQVSPLWWLVLPFVVAVAAVGVYFCYKGKKAVVRIQPDYNRLP